MDVQLFKEWLYQTYREDNLVLDYLINFAATHASEIPETKDWLDAQQNAVQAQILTSDADAQARKDALLAKAQTIQSTLTAVQTTPPIQEPIQ